MSPSKPGFALRCLFIVSVSATLAGHPENKGRRLRIALGRVACRSFVPEQVPSSINGMRYRCNGHHGAVSHRSRSPNRSPASFEELAGHLRGGGRAEDVDKRAYYSRASPYDYADPTRRPFPNVRAGKNPEYVDLFSTPNLNPGEHSIQPDVQPPHQIPFHLYTLQVRLSLQLPPVRPRRPGSSAA